MIFIFNDLYDPKIKIVCLRIATICNRQKLSAKIAGDQSSQLFLALYLSEPIESEAAVFDVKDRSFDVIARDFGIILRVYTDVSTVSCSIG